jgi:hypothetical protein
MFLKKKKQKKKKTMRKQNKKPKKRTGSTTHRQKNKIKHKRTCQYIQGTAKIKAWNCSTDSQLACARW